MQLQRAGGRLVGRWFGSPTLAPLSRAGQDDRVAPAGRLRAWLEDGLDRVILGLAVAMPDASGEVVLNREHAEALVLMYDEYFRRGAATGGASRGAR